jgi:predicted phage terminase large subunit-like protein
MVTAGVGGPITGRGADVFIIDDPVKNAEDAHSLTIRNKQWEWFQSVAYSRLEPGAAIILMMTRWHEDDLAGRILEQVRAGGEDWEVIKLPAIAKENDPLGRKPGEALWPERYDETRLAEIKRAVGSYWWSAQYDQEPVPETGAVFQRHWWRYWAPAGQPLSPVSVRLPDGLMFECPVTTLPTTFDEVLQSWDLAFKDTAASAYVVGQVWARKGADRFLLDQVRDKIDFPGTIAALKKLSARWPQATAKLVEDKANGPAVIAALQHEIAGLIPVAPRGDKVIRAHAVTAQVESGNVYLPHPHLVSWVDDFIAEVSSFPSGRYADQVDAMTQALSRFDQWDGSDEEVTWSPFDSITTTPSIWRSIGRRHDDSPAHKKWAKRNECVTCYELAKAAGSYDCGLAKGEGGLW